MFKWYCDTGEGQWVPILFFTMQTFHRKHVPEACHSSMITLRKIPVGHKNPPYVTLDYPSANILLLVFEFDYEILHFNHVSCFRWCSCRYWHTNCNVFNLLTCMQGSFKECKQTHVGCGVKTERSWSALGYPFSGEVLRKSLWWDCEMLPPVMNCKWKHCFAHPFHW